jgi:DNA-directed RNA polymerase subunit M/transcription elongation factor TFIIS
MYQEDPNKNKRISWLSIFSTLAELEPKVKVELLSATAFEMVDNLYKRYPTEEQHIYNHSEPTQIKPKSNKPTKCPKCQQFSLYHNTGISKKNNQPFENYKCKCGYIQWVDLKEKESTFIDSVQDEVQHIPEEYGG